MAGRESQTGTAQTTFSAATGIREKASALDDSGNGARTDAGASGQHEATRSGHDARTLRPMPAETPKPTDTPAVQPAPQTTQDRAAALDGDPPSGLEHQGNTPFDTRQPAEHEPQGLEPPRQGLEPTPEFQAALDERKVAIDARRADPADPATGTDPGTTPASPESDAPTAHRDTPEDAPLPGQELREESRATDPEPDLEPREPDVRSVPGNRATAPATGEGSREHAGDRAPMADGHDQVGEQPAAESDRTGSTEPEVDRPSQQPGLEDPPQTPQWSDGPATQPSADSDSEDPPPVEHNAADTHKGGPTGDRDAARKPDSSEVSGLRMAWIWHTSKATSDGRAFYSVTDHTMRRAAATADTEPGCYTADLHGSPDAFHVGNVDLDASDLASLIRRDDAWKSRPVRLMSCETGQGDDPVAQKLANELGVVVTAPTELAFSDQETGRVWTTSMTENEYGRLVQTVPYDGIWIDFHPDPKGEMNA
ncbi:hypothetical protein MXD59_21780 [Frankia sp. Ag45/Mut15]|uniref:DUF4347 domain-containing protein n=1 Tax=Frankia umida TaxID=573489 RepID=A0ABT0K3L8_9ACTN|nr:hypothetical protein [Frankia umida]MCK9878368.1 hypothetical protein [Frankia umida]